MAVGEAVPRPARKSEFTIRFATREAKVGWRDLSAVRRNALVDAWEFLTRNPLERTALNGPLRDELGTIIRSGESHEVWQLKLNQRDGARIWFYVAGNVVHLEQVFTAHPNATK